jgi:hypothetical protein
MVRKDKSLFIYNKARKNAEDEEVPLKKMIHKITKLCDCKAKFCVKRVCARWHVTQFVEEHNHELVQKFALKKYLKSHKKIPKEERKFIDMLHEVNISAGRIMQIMGEIYGIKKNVPYDTKTNSNYTASLGEKERFKDIPALFDYFVELKQHDPKFESGFGVHLDSYSPIHHRWMIFSTIGFFP